MKHTKILSLPSLALLLLAGILLPHALHRTADASPQGGPRGERNKRRNQDRIGGVPEEILALQSLDAVKPPAIAEAIAEALEAADEAAEPLIDTKFHRGRRLVVPRDFETIQAAIDAAESGDIVIVKAGTYYESLTLQDGVKVVSDSSRRGNEPVDVEGAMLKLPRRTLRTIIDGSREQVSDHGMIDFTPGAGRTTIVDGFTLQNLPKQNHHVPGHAHGINIRGASPVLMNCLIQGNGSTGLGSHVTYRDQESPMPERDFRWANIEHQASPVIYRNIVFRNLGLGIGCNHFSTPFILGNEVLENDDAELGAEPSPALGVKHGAAPTLIGNVVHANPGGGIQCKVGAPQGRHPIDRPAHPTVRLCVVFANGGARPAIGFDGAGSTETPVRILANRVFGAPAVGIGIQQGTVAVIEDNLVSGSGQPGITVNGSTALSLNRNRVRGSNTVGFALIAGSRIHEMLGNAADSNTGPRFLLRGSTIGKPSPQDAVSTPGEK